MGREESLMSDRKLIRPSMNMQNRTAMVVVLTDGTELKGWIEWYDKTCLKLNRVDAPNLLLFKHSIKFMFKEEELRSRRRRRPPASR
jgi:sRNA-binding regulator protein Hfq